jgi:hypothetical protein
MKGNHTKGCGVYSGAGCSCVATRITVDTSTFERSHGKKPRGFGSWAFYNKPDHGGEFDKLFWSHVTNYSEAKKAALAHAAKVGWNRLVVLP